MELDITIGTFSEIKEKSTDSIHVVYLYKLQYIIKK